jgi:hypothetical protein
MGVRDRGGRTRLAAVGVVSGYGLVASVFTTIAAVRLSGIDGAGAGMRLGCVLGTTGLLLLGAAVVAGVRRVLRARGR